MVDKRIKVSFKNDYSEGAHPRILQALQAVNLESFEGYGEDPYSEVARQRIRHACHAPSAQVYFTVGGTQTNQAVINYFLRSHESVIAAESGHINVHETGAIEFTGHKVCIAPSTEGKLTPEGILTVLAQHTDHHMVRPALVYLSQTTELGTFYTYSELEAISRCCRKQGVKLFVDGARLAVSLVASGCDLSLSDLAKFTDAFYIGGTKNGALMGEAVVFPSPQSDDAFLFQLKQQGALLAKGWVLGVQFATLFDDDLYSSLARNAMDRARQLIQGLQERGFNFLYPPQSNQLFPILSNDLIRELEREFDFYVWTPVSTEHSAVRWVTSWCTSSQKVNLLLDALDRYIHSKSL